MNEGFTVEIRGFHELEDNIEMLGREMRDWINAANRETGEEMAALAKRNVLAEDAYAFGELWQSIGYAINERELAVAVGSTAKHAPFVEFGTRPHKPPIAPLKAWCVIRELPESAAWGIQRKIARFGTPERPFLFIAFKVEAVRHAGRLRAKFAEGIKRFRKAA